MLDLLYTLRSVDGTARDHRPKCAWQDLPGRVKRDNEDREVTLTASYKHLLQRLQDGAPSVIETLDRLTAVADQAGSSDAARDAQVAGGWLRRLGARDFAATTWDADYSRLDGFWTCLRDAQVGLETTVRGQGAASQDLALSLVVRYVSDLAPLQPEIDKIERSRTTLAQRVVRGLTATAAALRMHPAEECDEFWNEESVGSTTS